MVYFITILIIFLLLLLSGKYLSDLVLYPKTRTSQENFEFECSKGRLSLKEYEELNKEEIWIKSPYGYDLYGIFIEEKDAQKTVILCHGITNCIYGSMRYINLFSKRGFNVLLYDHRNHGMSGGDNTTYGYYEKYDLKACIDWVINRCGEDKKTGIHGVSLGAATALQNAAIEDRVAFYIADCAYMDLKSIVKLRMKKDYHIPKFPFVYICELFFRLRTRLRFCDISPINSVREVKVPIFFIHGEDDTYIPKEMTLKMYEVKKGTKKLYIAKNSRHASSYWNNKEEYDRLIGEFLEEIGM